VTDFPERPEPAGPAAPGAAPGGSENSFPEVRRAFLADPLSLVARIPGIWPVWKPVGMSSHDAVRIMRKRLGLKRVGHAGTLDPLAEGLLLIMAGGATRLFGDIQAFPKTYLAGFRLGERTVSGDLDGDPPPGWTPTAAPPVTRKSLDAALERFRGEIEQIPPMHSALKRNGVPLYKLARRGVAVDRKPRKATVYAASAEDFDGVSGRLSLSVSSGFYVRTLIDDLGTLLGAGAVMTSLLRTAIGPFSLDGAVRLEGNGGKAGPDGAVLRRRG
jgi:tRNA pseudouridine55 synthase